MSLPEINTRIASAEQLADRSPGSVKLIAVSKVQPLARVKAVLAEGHRLFGENRVQEAAGKWPEFRSQFENVNVHLIGPLQTNKVKQALGLFEAIHSLDRPKLAKKIAAEAQAQGTCPELFIQVNTGEEPQKAGINPDDADAFIADCKGMDLNVTGLMVIPPASENPHQNFEMLRQIAERNGLKNLSMGMSSDFEDAIACGATHVRVGSAIFGARAYI